MRLTSYQKQKVRYVIGITRTLGAERRELDDELRETQVAANKARATAEAARRELEDILRSGRSYSTDRRSEVEQQSRAHVAACERGLAELEARVAEIQAQQRALEEHSRPASEFAQQLIRSLDNDEAELRREMGGSGPREVQGGRDPRFT
jgi:hypothetical protein